MQGEEHSVSRCCRCTIFPCPASLRVVGMVAALGVFLFSFAVAAHAQTPTPTPYVWGILSDGTIPIILGSHQDIAWEGTIPWCTEQRVEKIIKPVLGWMEEEWTQQTDIPYSFSAEHMLMLREYLDRYPNDKGRIRTFTGAGKFEWGATYNCPYESLLSSEGLVRETYLGRKWLKKELGGDCDTRSAWNPDVPARALQMPQILAKAGVDYMVISRIKLGLIKWNSPDGSSVLVYSNGQYSYQWIYNSLAGMLNPYVGEVRCTPLPTPPVAHTQFPPVKKDIYEYWKEKQTMTFDGVSYEVGPWKDYFEDPSYNLPHIFPFLYTVDMGYPSPWVPQLLADWAARQGPAEPDLVMSTSEAVLDSISQANPTPTFEEWTGARPNVWLYIHGPSHHYAVTAMREAGRLLPAAETFATIDSLLSCDFSSYPSTELAQGWADAIYPDVGWGGVDGADTDERFLQHALDGQQVGEDILYGALGSIAALVETDGVGGTPIVVFNNLSWGRTDPVICLIEPPGDDWSIVDSGGTPVCHQVLRTDVTATDPATGEVKTGLTEVIFIAAEVSSMGYNTYYLVDQKLPAICPILPSTLSETNYENKYYQIELAPGGIKSMKDVDLGLQEILDTSKTYGSKSFLGCELFTMYSWGFGAGEFVEVQQPDAGAQFHQLSEAGVGWTITETGPVRDAYEFETVLEHCTVREKLIFYRGLKRVDCEVSLLDWDGTMYREWRMALPVNLANGAVTYEVPMGVVQVGRDEIRKEQTPIPAGCAYTQECRMVNPRTVQNFITAAGEVENFGLTMSSSVAVCNYIFPPSNVVGPDASNLIADPILQPILLATRHSCNWHQSSPGYTQEGDHNYRFSILSHEGDWENGRKYGVQANNPLIAIVGVSQSPGAFLGESEEFCSVSPENVIVTAFKKRDDDVATPEGQTDGRVIVRMYDIEGVDSEATLDLFFTAEGAVQTNIIEEYYLGAGARGKGSRSLSLSGDSVSLEVGHHAIETLMIVPDYATQTKHLALQTGGSGSDYSLYLYNVPVPGDWTYPDALWRNPHPAARDFWVIPEGNNVVSMTAVDSDGDSEQELAIVKAAGGSDHCLYLYNFPVPGDWSYWDAASRNPSPLARDFWMITAGNDTALLADGGGHIAEMKDQGGDYNLYLYDVPYPGDWSYWDAAARNPSALARDLWIISQGDDAVAMCGMDTVGDGDSDSLLVARNEGGDYNVYLWNMPVPGDWTYWDAVARNPSPRARDFWSIPRYNGISYLAGINRGVGAPDQLGVMENDGGDNNFYVWSAPRPGDWTYWDAAARNASPLARDLWQIPAGNNTVGITAPH